MTTYSHENASIMKKARLSNKRFLFFKLKYYCICQILCYQVMGK